MDGDIKFWLSATILSLIIWVISTIWTVYMSENKIRILKDCLNPMPSIHSGESFTVFMSRLFFFVFMGGWLWYGIFNML